MIFLLIRMLNQLLTLSLGMMIMKSLSALLLHYPKVHGYRMQAALVDVIVDLGDISDMQFLGYYGH